MPELPEVETRRREAEQHLVDHTVREVSCRDDQVLRNTSPGGLGRVLNGARVESAERTGKWLTLRTDGRQDVVMHFGMTGDLHLHTDDEPCENDLVQVVRDDDAVVALHMTRKLGGVWVVRDDAERDEVRGALGPDALGMDADDLREAIGGSRGGLKSALMEQEKVAGLGNLLSDELCWQVQRHPRTPVQGLDDGDFERLADALTRALDVGLDIGHAPTVEGFLLDVREDRGPCPRNGSELDQGTVAGRTSVWCPVCQSPPD